MSSELIEQTFAEAKRAHQAGDHQRAEVFYQKVLTQNPNDAQALYLLGSLYCELGKFDAACKALKKSNSIRPRHSPALSMLGVVCSRLGQFDDAAQHFRAVAEASPQSADAQFNLAQALSKLKQYQSAATAYQAALASQPDHAAAVMGLAISLEEAGRTNQAVGALEKFVLRYPRSVNVSLALGSLLLRLSRVKESEEVYADCLANNPDNVDALLQSGSAHFRQGRFKDAEVLFRRLLKQAPRSTTANNHLAATLVYLDRLDEAESISRFSESLSPNDAETLTTLGLVLQEKGSSAEAEAVFRRAVSVKPTLAEAWNNIGMSLQHQGAVEAAVEYYDKAIALKPDFSGAYTNKAQALLALGRFDEGWGIYRFRFEQKVYGSSRRAFSLPIWDGELRENLKLLIWTDQGVGDEVLYSSMISDLVVRGVQIVLECSERLVPLLRRSFPSAAVVARRFPLDPAINELKPNAHISLAELGRFVRPSMMSFPVRQGHLCAEANAVRKIRERYEQHALGQPIVGVSWKSENPRTGKFKSVATAEWHKITKTKGVYFVSLQYGDVKADLEELGAVIQDPDISPLADLDAFAAQVAAMDLVVTVSNTTAHIAGALGVPVWTLLPKAQGLLWYWFIGGDYSPWYSSMRLFRQRKPNDWRDVMESIATNLEHSVSCS